MSTKDFLEKDYYKALGVAKTAKPAEIKKSYRKLARKYHPDANKGDAAAEERFKEISEAYNVLSDEKRRKEYDEARSLFGGGVPGADRAAGPAQRRVRQLRPRRPVRRRPGDDGRRLGDLLGGVFGRGGRTPRRPGRAAARTSRPRPRCRFSDAIDGATVALRLTGEGPCTACHGTGAKAGTVPRVCPTCEGTGQSSRNLGNFALLRAVQDLPRPRPGGRRPLPGRATGSGRAMSTRTIQARIPAGRRRRPADQAHGQGRPGRARRPGRRPVRQGARQAAPGVRPVGHNLTVTVPVSFAELALGAEVKVPTHRGAAGHRPDPAGHARTGGPSGSAARECAARTAPAATCSSPSRWRCHRN